MVSREGLNNATAVTRELNVTSNIIVSPKTVRRALRSMGLKSAVKTKKPMISEKKIVELD